MDLFDVNDLDEDWPFEVDQQAAHLFKHPELGLDDVADVWASDPIFCPAKPPAHWLMVPRPAVESRPCRLRLLGRMTAAGVGRSAATSPVTTLPAVTGRTDEPHHDVAPDT